MDLWADDLDVVFKALADPLRRRILTLLSDTRYHCRSGDKTVNGICVRDLSKHLDAPQSTISRHLAILSGAGLVFHDRDRTWHYYAVDPSRVTAALGWMHTLIPEDERENSPDGNFAGQWPHNSPLGSAETDSG